LYQIYFVIFEVIKPRLAKDYSKLEYSLFYFEHIAKMQKANLLKEYEDLSTSKILNEILSQVHEVSKIMSKKTEQLSKTINFLNASIILILFFILFSRII